MKTYIMTLVFEDGTALTQELSFATPSVAQTNVNTMLNSVPGLISVTLECPHV
jgi:hypothetical protein